MEGPARRPTSPTARPQRAYPPPARPGRPRPKVTRRPLVLGCRRAGHRLALRTPCKQEAQTSSNRHPPPPLPGQEPGRCGGRKPPGPERKRSSDPTGLPSKIPPGTADPTGKFARPWKDGQPPQSSTTALPPPRTHLAGADAKRRPPQPGYSEGPSGAGVQPGGGPGSQPLLLRARPLHPCGGRSAANPRTPCRSRVHEVSRVQRPRTPCRSRVHEVPPLFLSLGDANPSIISITPILGGGDL